jgi:hypothetical protein
VGNVILGQEQSDVLQGAQITFVQQFETWPGSGQAAGASGVTIQIAAAATPGAGSGTPVATTSAGIQGGPAQYQYTWPCPPAQVPGDYLVTWTGTVAGNTLTYIQAVTVAAMPSVTPAPGGYATASQYQAWSGDLYTPGALVTVALQRASEDIDNALIGAVYAVNANGMPADAMVIGTFMRACCAQCQFLLADNDPAGIKRMYVSTSMGGVSQTRAAAVTAMALPPLAPRAAQILHTAGVLQSAALISW